MHPRSHDLITREVLRAFDVDARDVEAAVGGAVEIDREFAKLGGGTWAISHSFNDGGRLAPEAEKDSVGPSDITTFRVSHHLGGVYTLVAYYALPKWAGWRFLGQAFHIFHDLATPFHSQFANLWNLLHSLDKSGAHHQFEQVLADYDVRGIPAIRRGISHGLALALEPAFPDSLHRIVQDILLPDLSKWSGMMQPQLHDLFVELKAGLGSQGEILAIGEECLEKASSYCTQLCLLLGMKPRVDPIKVVQP